MGIMGLFLVRSFVGYTTYVLITWKVRGVRVTTAPICCSGNLRRAPLSCSSSRPWRHFPLFILVVVYWNRMEHDLGASTYHARGSILVLIYYS